MAIIKQYDKRSGITYVYEASYWRDPESGQSRSRRHLVGRLDTETGEVVPTDGRNRRPKAVSGKKTTDYEAAYRKLLKKCESQEEVIKNLRHEIRELKGKNETV